MAIHQYRNNPSTTLSGAVTAGATSISVTSGALFPTRGNFTIIVDSEIMLVTGVAGTVWTVTRGRESTTAAAHNNNATVTQILTVDSFLNANHFDVRFFGATGDGVTDDTAAVQAACDAAIPVGGEVFFPIGTYIIDTITTTGDESQPLSIRGAGFGSVLKLKGGTTADSMFKFFGTVSALSVQDLKVDGNKANVSGDGRSAFRVHANNMTFNNVMFVDTIQEGIYHTAGSSPLRSRGSITNCIFYGCGRYGIASENVAGLTVTGCVAENCGAGLVDVEPDRSGETAYAIAITGNTVKNSGSVVTGAAPIQVWGTSGAVGAVGRATITGNVIDGTALHGIQTANISRCVISGNNVYGAGGHGICNRDAGTALGSTGLTIANNVISECGALGSNTYSSIYLERTTDSVVFGNVSIDSTPRLKYHVELNSTCNQNLVGGNNYKGTALTGQQIIGGASNTLLASHRQ